MKSKENSKKHKHEQRTQALFRVMWICKSTIQHISFVPSRANSQPTTQYKTFAKRFKVNETISTGALKSYYMNTQI